jgi:hypothetical protein
VSQGEFATNEVWDAFTALLTQQLPDVDVKKITGREFTEGGELITVTPSVRCFFAGESATSTSDTQRLSYNVVGRLMVFCADNDLGSPEAQALVSLKLASRVKTILIGARVVLPSGDVSEPATYCGMEFDTVQDLGITYIPVFEVPGLAQFAGANANPAGESD